MSSYDMYDLYMNFKLIYELNMHFIQFFYYLDTRGFKRQYYQNPLCRALNLLSSLYKKSILSSYHNYKTYMYFKIFMNSIWTFFKTN